MKAIAILSLTISLAILGISFNSASASHFTNSAFLTEGSGFAVSDDFIKFSEIDFGLVSKSPVGTRINFSIDDGFISLDTKEYDATDLNGSFLRDGKFLRVVGKAEAPDNNQIDVRFFGRLIEDSKQGSIYSFTGKIIQANIEYKVIYTSKISEFKLEEKLTTTEKEEAAKTKTIRILPEASTRSVGESYIGALAKYTENIRSGEGTVAAQYLSKTRMSIKPGDSITFINDDTVPHKILSGKENYNSRHDQYTPDGRIDSGTIMPGQSVTINFNEEGFYRLFDPDYPWVNVTVYSFSLDVLDQIIKGSSKQLGN